MKFRNITDEEFRIFSENHPLVNFYQTNEWALLKEKGGWKKHIVGLFNENKLVGAAILLEKLTLLKKSIFYSPRGFLIDFNDKNLLLTFTKEIKEYIKTNKGIFLKIDPYVILQERNKLGEIVPNKENNKKVVEDLKELGYKHFGFNIYQETMQPRWIYTLNINNKNIEELLSDMDPKTRQIIRKNEKSAIFCKEIDYNELDKFKDIMKHTGDRRDFIDRPLSYYQNMYTCLKKNDSIKILLAQLDTNKFISTLEEEMLALKSDFKSNEKSKEAGKKFNEAKFLNRQKEIENNIERLEKKIVEITLLQKTHEDIITLGGILFIINKNEVLSLYGGTYKEFMAFQSPYSLHYYMIKYAVEHNCKRYNFYGITGDFTKENPLYGLYVFKSGFGGEVVELIGEFDLVIDKFYYYLYLISFNILKGLKKLKNKFIK